MQVGMDGGRLVAQDDATGHWLPIGGPWGDDLLVFLAGGDQAREEARALMASAEPAGAPSGLPFQPRSLRDFALWEAHMLGAARTMVRRFASPGTRAYIAAYERLTRRTFPGLRPGAKFHEVPGFYMTNHTTVIPDSATVAWPRYTAYLDFELELGVIVARPVRDCTPEEGRAAIGGFCVINDWSARDVQWDDMRRGVFGGVVKAKTFATSMSAMVVTADALLDRWRQLTGRVRVNGAVWCEGSAADAAHDLGAMVAYAAEGEPLGPGDVLGTGTLPGCCGLELDRWIRPGDVVELELDGVGHVRNQVGDRPAR